ncbi:hypothetical protein GCM10009066_27590 [Halarchaeum salinum]|uniref:Uncharacterized protein n=1 Tax=Halarchaeum salinum TaxID=489912 RepID=A0AAV3SBK9_9EURY
MKQWGEGDSNTPVLEPLLREAIESLLLSDLRWNSGVWPFYDKASVSGLDSEPAHELC